MTKEKCPDCGVLMKPIIENNGFEEPNGPSKMEITGYECPACGYKED